MKKLIFLLLAVTLLTACGQDKENDQGAETLVELGYANIKGFGGIMDWPYEVEKT